MIVNPNRQIVSDGVSAATEEQAVAAMKTNEWNEGVIIAQGEHLIHLLNGVVVTEVKDRDTPNRSLSGVLAIQAHALNASGALVQFRNIRLKVLSRSGPQTDAPVSATDSDGISLFNGRDLTGWDGDPRFWSVEDGAIKGQSREGQTPETGNTYLIWKGGVVGDFELSFTYKLVKGESGSGVLYRGKDTGNWHAQGYQADFWPAGARGGNGSEIISGAVAYEAPGGGARPGFGSLCPAGQKVVWGGDGQKQVLGYTEGGNARIQSAIREGDWNTFVVTARGGHIIHQINGNITADIMDNDVQRRFLSGILGLKMRANKGRPMLVYFKDIRLKHLVPEAASASGSLDWIPMFDGKTLSGWTASTNASEWQIDAEGALANRGSHGYLYSPQVYQNAEIKAEIKLEANGDGAIGFRSRFHSGKASCYQVKANLDHKHPLTGSLFKVTYPNDRYRQELALRIEEELVQPLTWFTLHIVAIGNRIVIKLNDQIIGDYTDRDGPLGAGRVALQQWNPGVGIWYRNVMVKPLPLDELQAWTEARKDIPELPANK